MRSLGLAEIADRVHLEPGGWFVVVVAESNIASSARGLEEELSFLLQGDTAGCVRVLTDPTAPQALLDDITRMSPNDVAVLPLSHGLAEPVLRFLDYERARLIRGPRGVIVTSAQGVEMLAAVAPNVWSWIGPRAWTLDPAADHLDVAARLASLRAGTGSSDAEVLRRAEAGTLEPDPIFAEWLILLGRGDLLGR